MIVPSRQAPTKVSLRVGDAPTGKEEAMTILQEYMDKHQGSAQKYQEALGQFPSGVTHDNRFASPSPCTSPTAKAPSSGTWTAMSMSTT